MATLTLDLSKRCTSAEEELATHLQVAALTNDQAEIDRLMKHKTIKSLLKRGVLRVNEFYSETENGF